MATIPLPALDVRPPQQQPDMLGEYGKLMQIKQQQAMAPLQQQMAQQAVQSGQLDIQAKQREAASANALMASFKGLDPTDPQYFQKGLATAQSTGQVLPQHLQSIMNTAMEYRGKVTDQSQKIADSLYSMGQGYLSQDDATMAQNWPMMRQKILNLEGMDPTKTAQSLPEQFPGRATVQNLTTAVGMSAAGMRAASAMKQAGTSAATEQATHGALSPEQIQQLNQGFAQRYSVLNPGKQPPTAFQLSQGQTVDDFNRIDKLLQGTETAQGTAQQQAATNQLRQQMATIAQQNAQNAQEARQQGIDAKNRKWVSGEDASGRTVAGPVSELEQLGVKNLVEVPAQEVRDIQNARNVVKIARKIGDPNKPETMGTLQLIDSLDKDNKLGLLASRYNRFLTTGVGASPGDDPRIITLINKNMLQQTGTMLAHFGAAGGRSPVMLEHFTHLSDAGKMDGVTLRAGTKAIVDYMEDKGMMPSQSAQPQGAAQPVPNQQQSGQPMTITLPSGKKVTIE